MAPRIVLSLLVKNESASVERCLAAALPHVDGAVVVDTGSTDGTVERVRLATAGKPGRLVTGERWSDFGTNRTRAAESARTWAAEQGFALDGTYLLLLDAAMVLHAGSDFRREALTAPAYEVLEDDGDVRCYRPRLVRLSHAWTSVGTAHARWVASPPTEPERLASIWIEDHGAGGNQKTRLERNIALLARGLEQQPDDPDAWLVLGVALADSGRHGEAIGWLEKRFARGGSDAEATWYARYRQGLCHLALGERELALAVLGDAVTLRPERAEPLAALARHYRERGENEPAFRLARRALALPYPERDRLGVRRRAYGREPIEELSITAFYVQQHAVGLEACERLLADRDPVSREGAPLTAKNELFYLPPAAKLERSGAIQVSRELRTKAERFFGLATANTTEYVAKNPTLARVGGRLYLNVPLVNYWHERGRVFVPNDADGMVRTRNAVLEWDLAGARPLSERESAIQIPPDWQQTPRIRGLEDQRWVVHGGRVWLTATTFHVPGAGADPRVVLGCMREDLGGVERLQVLKYERARPIEKNWLPWSLDDRLLLLYSYDPFVVLAVATESGECSELTRWTPPWSAARWRGGTPPVAYPERPDRFVMLVHETAWPGDATVYLHRWVELSAARGAGGERVLRIERYSRLFSFEHQGVEYACGLLAPGDGTLFVTFGSEEREARFAVVSLAEVEALLGTGATDSVRP